MTQSRSPCQPTSSDDPPTVIDGVSIRTLSPLVLVHLRAGASATRAFGPERPGKDVVHQARMIETFFRDADLERLRRSPRSATGSRALGWTSVRERHPSDCTYADRVERAIVRFHLDAHGEWVAELACGHLQHVRHQPPFHLRPWVLEAEGRQQRLGTPLECRLCDQNVPAPRPSPDVGGEAACLAHLVCPECGAVLDGGTHRPGCASAV